MKKYLSILLSMLLFIVGCNTNDRTDINTTDSDNINIVTTISILADLTQNVVGTKGNVKYLVPRGDNPEDYEMIPGDFYKVSEADLILFNGHNFENAMERSVNNITNKSIVFVTKGITPIPLVGDEDFGDPHAWFDPLLVVTYIENIYKAIVEIDPDNASYYRENADNYINELFELNSWIEIQVKQIPMENRILVISENALKYYGAAYGFETEGIWELNAHEEGTPQQISRVIDLVNNRNVKSLFVESTLDKRYIESISRETGVSIAGEIYTDALGKPGSGADTYIDMMKYNTKVFVNGLR